MFRLYHKPQKNIISVKNHKKYEIQKQKKEHLKHSNPGFLIDYTYDDSLIDKFEKKMAEEESNYEKELPQELKEFSWQFNESVDKMFDSNNTDKEVDKKLEQSIDFLSKLFL